MKRNQRNGWFYLVLALFLLHGGLAYAQWTESGGNITTSDNVGIGTTSPSSALHVKDSSGSVNLYLETSTANDATIRMLNSGRQWSYGARGDVSNYFIIRDVTAGTDRLAIDTSGNVGIGTTSPSRALEVSGGGAKISASQAFLELSDTQVDGKLWWIQNGWPTVGDLTFGISGLGGKITLDENGNLGIGTLNPSAKLHVAGDATIDGNIAAKYQDVAEWVRTPAHLAPGTVVVIDPVESNRVLPASRPYDTRIAGVVSSQPGIILGEAGDDKAKVAHSGRVKVKADAQFGPIAVGDLLVSSSTSGYAMVSKPIDFNGISLHRPGTIVGKALEPLKEGQGEILVLLTLQ